MSIQERGLRDDNQRVNTHKKIIQIPMTCSILLDRDLRLLSNLADENSSKTSRRTTTAYFRSSYCVQLSVQIYIESQTLHHFNLNTKATAFSHPLPNDGSKEN